MKSISVLVRAISCALVSFLLLPGDVRADDPQFYVRKNTWNETVLESRAALQRYKADLATLAGLKSGPWYWVGPFTAEKPYEQAFGPEEGFNADKRYGEGRLAWKIRSEWMDGDIIQLPSVDNSANYMYREISVEEDTVVTFYLGSDDGIQMWLNDVQSFQHKVDRGCDRNQEIVKVYLKSGINHLLLKVNNGGGPTAFYFSLYDIDQNIIWKLVERDFTAQEDREEMDWESADGIWNSDWPQEDLGALARRYAEAGKKTAETAELSAPGVVARVVTASDLWRVRAEYLSVRHLAKDKLQKEMVSLTLTPKPGLKPRINGPKIFGVRPGAPFLYTIPATGQRPMEFAAKNLPAGLAIDPVTGRVTGMIADTGKYLVTLRASNAFGKAERAFSIIVGNNIALTPPLGWNSWNCFAGDVDDAKVRAAADAMVRSGLVDHGWAYINIDDCWMVKSGSQDPILGGRERDEKGRIQTNKKFPDMKALSSYVHEKGLKLGIYSSPGPQTCAGFAGSYRFEAQDAAQYAEWGIDYLKYDWCSYGGIAKDQSLPELKKPYEVMKTALKSVKRDIVYSLCQYGMGNVWEWGVEVGGNCWRTTGDITDTWESMEEIGFGQAGHELFAGPGHWNDPDMLVVGWVGWGPRLHPTRLTPQEQRTHITLWSLLAAPLLIGCDMTRLDEFTLGLLTNDEVLEVHQDPLGKQAGRVVRSGDLEVWARQLDDGSIAVGLFNRGPKSSRVTVNWSDLGIRGVWRVRDIWQQKDTGESDTDYSTTVGRHGAAMVRVSKR